MQRLRTSRRLAAWACLITWMMMIVGPLHHASGHTDDHVHVAGMVVKVAGAPAHTHEEVDRSAPSDLIAEARSAWDGGEENVPPGDEPSDRDQNVPPHGFDTFAHFGAAPIVGTPAIVALFLQAPQRADAPEPVARALRSMHVDLANSPRAPPAISA